MREVKHEIVTGDSPPVTQSSFCTERESGWACISDAEGWCGEEFVGQPGSACEKEVWSALINAPEYHWQVFQMIMAALN